MKKYISKSDSCFRQGKVSAFTLLLILAYSLFVSTVLIPSATLLAQDQTEAGDEKPATDENPEPKTPENETPENQEGADQQGEELGSTYPTLEEMQDKVPSAKDLALKPPVDWMVLDSNRVIPVMQVFPRPDTIEKMEEAVREFEKNAPPRTTEEEEQEHEEQRKRMQFLEFSIHEDANLKNPRLFLIHITKINTFIYYEDLMLRRIDILRKEYRIRDAFELLHQLRRRAPDWKGIDSAHNDILYSAAEFHARNKEYEDSLVKLEELYQRDPKYRQLSLAMGSVIDHLVEIAVGQEDYRQGRFFMRRLGKYYPDHEVLKKWTQNLTAQCQQLINQAEQDYNSKSYAEAVTTIQKAALVWPAMEGLSGVFNRICQRYQVLRVGVINQPGKNHGTVRSNANERYLELTETFLFELDHMEDVPHYRTRYFEKWTPTDLGRQIIFDLKPGRAYWESQPVMYSPDLVSMLKSVMNPASRFYDQRLEYFIDSVSIKSPYQFEISFAHVPLKPEAIFRFPFPAVPSDNQEQDLPSDLKPSRFQLSEKNEDRTLYTRVKVEPEDLKLDEYHLSEVQEVRFDSYEKLVQSLIREELDMVPVLPPSMARTLSKDERFFVLPYSIPEIHIIQFNPRSEFIRNRQIRRAMAYGLDLNKILNENYLGAEPYVNATITSAPFARDSYAFNKTIEPRKVDLSAAIPLVLITKNKMGGELPELKMTVNPEPMAMEAAKAIVKTWNRIGIPVRILGEDEDASDWDLSYRCLKMTEPLTEMWSFVSADPQHKIESLIHLPDWIRAEFVQLERTSNLNGAIRILQNLHRHLYEEVEYIPLWEVYHHFIVSKKVEGYSENPISPYHNIERWTVTPWYSRQYQ